MERFTRSAAGSAGIPVGECAALDLIKCAIRTRQCRGLKIRSRYQRSRSAGFTYIGLLLLVAMMGIGLLVASQVWQTVQKREKEDELLFVGDQFRRALRLYYANSPGGARYPRQLEDLLKDPRYPNVRRYLRKIYRDPITGSAEWGLLKGPGDLITGVYSLSEEEPLKKTEFRLVDRSFEDKTKYTEWVFVPRIGAGPIVIPPSGSVPPIITPQPQPGTTRSGPLK